MLAGLQGRGLVHLGQRMGAGSYVQTGKLTQTGIAHVGERRKAPRVCQDEQLLEFRIPAPTSRAGFLSTNRLATSLDTRFYSHEKDVGQRKCAEQ